MDLLLDVSGLPPPEPLEQILDALEGLAPGDRLLVRLGRQPYPLYDLLRRMGYRWEATRDDGGWRILIEPEPEPEPEPEHSSGSPARS